MQYVVDPLEHQCPLDGLEWGDMDVEEHSVDALHFYPHDPNYFSGTSATVCDTLISGTHHPADSPCGPFNGVAHNALGGGPLAEHRVNTASSHFL
jgi:hypothetical protein